ncbi:DNA processing protein [Candidatus Xenohaliotis californiensis]|uniref:DNA processing protein n=1 Tax=Candidatus Xenohaliotis californiensis TaxID=84677 RepID=A0ABP0ERJ7_9RICK|nr:DNA processing protein [Candidatus Xenohaliotis californiensis]
MEEKYYDTVSKVQTIKYMCLARSGISLSSMYAMMTAYGSVERALEYLPVHAKKIGKNFCIPDFASMEAEYNQIVRMGGLVISLYDKLYPDILRSIKFPPFVIYVVGDLSVLSMDMIAIVGSRNASFAGKKFTRTISHCLSEDGYVICSGLAHGIDAAAHEAAIASNFPNVAVLGCGIDIIYPKENSDIYYQIAKYGLLISEFPLGSKPLPKRFPIRNRIIAGLSIATVVVEAARRSGSLITARYALEFGRDVFAVPGSPLDDRYSGTNQLIKDGAILVDSCDTIIEALQFCTSKLPNGILSDSSFMEYDRFVDNTETKKDDIDDVKSLILSMLSYSPISVEQIVQELNDISISVILVALVDLNLEGKIEHSFMNEICLMAEYRMSDNELAD